MRNYIILNGQNSNSISGLLIQSLPPITKPAIRTTIEEIDGRDGDIVTKLGYSSYTKEFLIGLYGDFDIDEVIAYFNTEGNVVFSNEPEKFYKYQILEQIDYDRLIRFRTATVKMHCQPFKYSTTEGTEEFGGGNNLMTIPDYSKTTNGITLTAQNGTISISGTGTAATEFYVPVTGLNLAAGSYTIFANANGAASNSCSFRLIGSAPTNSDSFGGKYITLANNGTVSLSATLPASKNYGYLWFYLNAGTAYNFTATFELTNDAESLISDEGSSIVLEDTADAPLASLVTKGDTDQITYSGKNLLNEANIEKITRSGITVTYNATNSTITINGSATARAGFVLPSLPTTEANVSYAFSYWYISGSGTCEFHYQDSSNSWQGYNIDSASTSDRGFSRSFNTPMTFDTRVLRVQSGTTCSNLTFHLQFEKSSTVTDYEPYVGGTASPNPSYPQTVQTVTGEQTVKITGKNLFDKSSVVDGVVTNTGTIDPNYGQKTSGYIAVKPNTTYHVSGRTAWTVEGTYTADREWIQRLTSDTFVTPANCYWVRVTCPTSDLSNCQLEENSTATVYEPYQEQSYTIDLDTLELCKMGDYQDYIYKSSDKWYKHKAIDKVVVDGSKYYVLRTNGSTTHTKFYTSANTELNYPIANATAIVSDHFIANAGANEAAYSGSAICSSTASDYDRRLWFSVPNSVATTAIGFKDWLTSNHVTVYYILKTPIEEEITDETLIDQLEELHSKGSTYRGRTYLNALAEQNNLPHIMAVSGVKDIGNITVTNSGNYIAKPTITIYGSGNVGLYLNGYQIFEIELGDNDHLTIDSAAMEAYQDTTETLRNRSVTGDYDNLALNVGSNTLYLSGAVTKVEISNYSRWL